MRLSGPLSTSAICDSCVNESRVLLSEGSAGACNAIASWEQRIRRDEVLHCCLAVNPTALQSGQRPQGRYVSGA